MNILKKRIQEKIENVEKKDIEELKRLEAEIEKETYGNASIEEIIATEIEIIYQELNDNINSINKKMSTQTINKIILEYLELQKNFKNFKKNVEKKDFTKITKQELIHLKGEIAMYQCSINIEPLFITELIEENKDKQKQKK